jgi:multiple sugar transport system permease protein
MSVTTMGFSRYMRRNYRSYLLLLPSFALIAVFKVYPILYSVVGSFLTRGARGVTKFAGLKNFQMLFADPTILNSIWVTIKFNLITVPLQIVLALTLAILLNRKVRLVQTVRTLLYIPVAINMVIASTIWNMMLNPSSGPANAILGALGIPSQPFLTSNRQALWVIIMICCWKGVSY